MEYLQYILDNAFATDRHIVLNLVISGIPSILDKDGSVLIDYCEVLNLIITGIPSIHKYNESPEKDTYCFKPYYNWNAFNTHRYHNLITKTYHWVLNLIITGMPSILIVITKGGYIHRSFKPYYNWNAFNT